jgi:hypothetical protein
MQLRRLLIAPERDTVCCWKDGYDTVESTNDSLN